MDADVKLKLRKLLDIADEALDNETYEEMKRHDFDAPDDAEVSITFLTVRRVNALFSVLDKIVK